MIQYTYPYPVLAHAWSLYAEYGLRPDLDDTLLLACQHMLEPQLRMLEILRDAGLPPENVIVAGKSYSTNADVLRAVESLGFSVAPFSHSFDPLAPFDAWFAAALNAFVATELGRRDLSGIRRAIVLDDGGFMHVAASRNLPASIDVFGIEQTTSGSRRVREAGVGTLRRDIARSQPKQNLEAPIIAKLCGLRAQEAMARHGIRDPKILVCGLGTIGRNVAVWLDHIAGLETHGADADVARVRTMAAVVDLECKGRLVSIDEVPARIGEFNVLIGASGSTIAQEADYGRLAPGALLLSVSSSDREFHPLPFRRAGSGIHDDGTCEGRVLANAGFPITFYGNRLESPAPQIELTVAMLLAAALEACSDPAPPFPLVVERIVEVWRSNLPALK
jgi:hypothetical protein